MTFLTELRQEVKVGNEVQLVKSMITKLMQFKTYQGKYNIKANVAL